MRRHVDGRQRLRPQRAFADDALAESTGHFELTLCHVLTGRIRLVVARSERLSADMTRPTTTEPRRDLKSLAEYLVSAVEPMLIRADYVAARAEILRVLTDVVKGSKNG